MIDELKIKAADLKVGDTIVVGAIPEYDEKIVSITKKGNYVHLEVSYLTWGNIRKFNQPRRYKLDNTVTIHK